MRRLHRSRQEDDIVRPIVGDALRLVLDAAGMRSVMLAGVRASGWLSVIWSTPMPSQGISVWRPGAAVAAGVGRYDQHRDLAAPDDGDPGDTASRDGRTAAAIGQGEREPCRSRRPRPSRCSCRPDFDGGRTCARRWRRWSLSRRWGRRRTPCPVRCEVDDSPLDRIAGGTRDDHRQRNRRGC